MTVDPVVIRRLVDAHATSRDTLIGRIVAAVRASAARFDGWYDDAAIAAWAGQVVAVVEAGQRQTAALTDAYLARVATEITGRTVRPVGAVDVAGLRAVPHTDAYTRVAGEYRYRVSEGSSPAEAGAGAVLRAGVMAHMDEVLAFRAQSRRFMVVHRVDGYRRVIRPELSRHGTCGLCAAASDRVYGGKDLLPIHERCHCTVLPILNGADPGRSLNRDEFRDLYDAADGSTEGADLKRVRVTVHQHGELGPVLRVQGQEFRSPADVARDAA